MRYTVDYFIAKFEAIPEENWTTRVFTDYQAPNGIYKHCALGHCGFEVDANTTEEGESLANLFFDVGLSVIDINDDDRGKFTKYGATPKQRVLHVLYSLKKGVKFP